MVGWRVGAVAGHTWLWFEIFAVEVAGAAGFVMRGFGARAGGRKEGRKEGKIFDSCGLGLFYG